MSETSLWNFQRENPKGNGDFLKEKFLKKLLDEFLHNFPEEFQKQMVRGILDGTVIEFSLRRTKYQENSQ